MSSPPTSANVVEAFRSPASAQLDSSTADSPNSNPDENISDDGEEYQKVEVEDEEYDTVVVEEDGEDAQDVEGEDGEEEDDDDGEEEADVEDDGEYDAEVEEDGEDDALEHSAVPAEVGAHHSLQNAPRGNKEDESDGRFHEYSCEDKQNTTVDDMLVESKEKSNLNNEGPKILEFGSHLGSLDENKTVSNFANEHLEKISEQETTKYDEKTAFDMGASIPDSITRRVPWTEHSSYFSDKEYSKEISKDEVRNVASVPTHSSIMHSENDNYSNFFRIKNVSGTVGQRDIMGNDHILPKDNNPIKADALKHRPSSLPIPQLSPQSISVAKTTSDVICDFFAKGWCIKGSSCKFVHVKSNSSTTLRPPEGFTDEEERPDSSRSTFQPDYSTKMKSVSASDFLSDKIHIEEHGRKRNWSQFCNDGSNERDSYLLRSTSPFKGVGSISSGFSAFKPSSNIPSSPHNILSSQTSFDASVCLPASRSSTSVPFKRNSSPFSGYDMGNLQLTDSSKVVKFSQGYKSEISSYDWVPSVPFRPSVFITPSKVSSPSSQYDPLRDSIESNVGHNDKYSSALSYISGASGGILPDEHANGKFHQGSFDNDFIGDKYSVLGSNNHRDSMLHNNISTVEVNAPIDMPEHVGNSVSIALNRVIDFNQNTLPITSCLDEVGKSEKFNRHLEQKHRKNLDKDFKPHKDNLKHDANGDAYKETKLQRHFRTVLVDYVKDLVKPSWRVGLISKDSHNLIVKKAVDKVIGTLHPHQMPSSFDAIKHYILAAEPKITKLVEGYIEKYGKS